MRRGYPPTPAASSPVRPPRLSSPLAAAEPCASEHPPADTSAQLARIAFFIRAGQPGAELSVPLPTEGTLHALDELLNRPPPEAGAHGRLAAALGRLDPALEEFTRDRLCRVRYYYTPRAERPVLTLYHHMPTAIHEATALFVQRALLSRSGPLRRILSAHEIKGIAAGTAASPLPGGPADKGFRDPTASAAKHRHKPRALQKRADIALEHHPSNVALSADRSDDGDHSSESEQEEAQTAPHAEPQVLPFPHAIIEVGYSQKYPSLVADAEDWLVSSQGAIRTVFIVCVEYATIPQSSITPHAPPPDDTASNNDPDDDDDAPASSPPRAADSPPASSPEPTPTVYSRAAHDIATDPALVDAYIAPLNAFLEVWEYVPTAPGSTALRCPRVEIFANNVPARHVKVPMSRADFDLPEAQGKPSGQRNISWSKLTEYLIKARKADAYSRMTTLAKKRKADKRRAVGDVGGEYHADEDEEAGEDKRDRGARDMPVMGERETRGTEAKRRKM